MASDLQKSGGSNKAANFKEPHRARVINDKDPKKLGRIQVTVQSIMEETDPEKCLWVLPDDKRPGSSPANKSLNVPEIGTEVEVFTKGGKEDVLYFRGSIDSQLTQTPEVFDKNYPATVGDVNSIGDLFRLDRSDGELEFYRHLFSQMFRIDSDGHIYLHLPGNLTISADNIYFKAKTDFAAEAGAKVGVSAGANFEIEGKGGDCSINAKGGTLGLNGGPEVRKNSGVFAGIIGGLVGDISSHVDKVREAVSNAASQVANVLSRDESNRKRIGKE